MNCFFVVVVDYSMTPRSRQSTVTERLSELERWTCVWKIDGGNFSWIHKRWVYSVPQEGRGFRLFLLT